MNTDRPLIDVLGQYQPNNTNKYVSDNTMEQLTTLNEKIHDIDESLKNLQKEKRKFVRDILSQLKSKYEGKWRIHKFRDSLHMNLKSSIISGITCNINLELSSNIFTDTSTDKYFVDITYRTGNFNTINSYKYTNDNRSKIYNVLNCILDKLHNINSINVGDYIHIINQPNQRYGKLKLLFENEIENILQ